jgi:TolB-like protein
VDNKPLPPYTGDEPHVFVSYAHADAVALREIRWLQDQGIRVWYDAGISPGNEWSQALAQAISGSEKFLYFITPRSVASENCRQELNFALAERRSVLAVHLEETDVPQGLRLSLSHRQAILKTKLDESAYRTALLQAVRASSDASAAVAVTLPKRANRKRLIGPILAVVLLAIAIAGIWVLTPRPAPGPVKVAVLPFTDATPTGELDWLAAGLSFELNNMISQFPGVAVMPQALLVGHTAADLPSDVGLVLYGSVEAKGGSVTAQVELNQMPDGAQLWSQSFSGNREAPYELQSQIASRVSRFFLESVLGMSSSERVPIDLSGPKAPEARTEYFNYLLYAHGGDHEREDYWLERALELDPTWGGGYLNMAEEYAGRISSAEDRAEWEPRARAALERARALGLADAPAFLKVEGYHLLRLDGDLDAAEQRFRRVAVSGNPSAYLDLMMSSGLAKEAEPTWFALTQRVYWLPLVWFELAEMRAINGDLEGSYEASKRFEDMIPPDTYPTHLFPLFSVLTRTGRLDEAKRRLDRLNEVDAQGETAAGLKYISS